MTLYSKIKPHIRRMCGRRREIGVTRHVDYAAVYSNKAVRALLKLLSIPRGILITKYTLPSIEMEVTLRCTLNCKECSHLMPAHKRSNTGAHDYAVEPLLDNIELLLPMIDKCLVFSLLGGEPLLYQKLHVIIDKLISEKKIKRINIVTNGTLLPQDENLSVLKHKKVFVTISNYGPKSTRKDELIALLKENGIRFKIAPYLAKWRETNGMEPRGYSKAKMHSVFHNCEPSGCKTLHDGKIYLCPQALHGTLLGILKENEHEIIDLRTCSKTEFRQRLNRMYDKPDGITSCYYCRGGDLENAREVPCAEQV